jgi:pimeloyl-ACP methyl ester carboxylesterase
MKLTLMIISLTVTLTFIAVSGRGKPAFYRDSDGSVAPGSIAEKTFVPIGGVDQGMIIRTRDINNPVLLFVHGGPGFPTYFLVEKYNPGLEEHFTVCYWEQRCGGLSWSPGMTPESITLERLTADAIEVTNYLRQRFEKEKIYILAHSGGTTIALPAVAQAPELYHAYIAMAQLTRQRVSEKIAFDYMLELYRERNDHRMVKRLEKYRGLESDEDVLAFYNSGLRDMTMHELGIGTMRTMRSVFKDIFVESWRCRAYTLQEKINLWRAKMGFLPKTNLRRETLFTDFTEGYPELKVMVYFMCGRHDLTVNAGLTKEYYDSLKAPVKRLYLFENSAHSPLFEEPERFREVVKETLAAGSRHPAAGEK